jgi:hypothetical protein
MTHNQRSLLFRKSTRSGGSGGNCVEWAHTTDGVYLRDSKDPDGPTLFLTLAEWKDFLIAARDGSSHVWILPQPSGCDVAKEGEHLHFTEAEWAAFIAAILLGECDRLPLPA